MYHYFIVILYHCFKMRLNLTAMSILHFLCMEKSSFDSLTSSTREIHTCLGWADEDLSV